MKFVVCIILLLALSNCLFEDSKYVKTLKWANFKEEVMKSKEPWFLNFGADKNCQPCVQFAKIWEEAAKLEHGKVNYGYVEVTKEKGIVNFFGIGGQNHQIFLGEVKPEPAGAPSFFSWPKDLKNILSFTKNEINMKKKAHLTRGTQWMKKLQTKVQLDTQVLKSKDPWFILFCSDSMQQDCLDILHEFNEAAKTLEGKAKFAYVDTDRSEITSVFGINGIGVCIFLNVDKPGPVGSPSLVGSQLKKKDYEKHIWDIIELTPTDSSKQIVAQYPSVPEVTYQQIMRHQGAYIVLFYSGSTIFGNDEQLKQQLEAFQNLKDTDKLKFGKMSVDDNKWIVSHFDIWPVPTMIYFPIGTKTAETLIAYEGEYNLEQMQQWSKDQLFDNENDKQIILTRQNFESTVMNSQESWFIQFYTLNKQWCRKCEHLQPEWKKVSNRVNGKVNIAKFNCDNGKDICQRFEVFNFPKLVYMPAGQKSYSLDKCVDYDGAFSTDPMMQFALDNFNNEQLSKLSRLDSPDVFQKYCKDFNGICFITFVPKIGAPDSKDRSWYLNEIERTSKELLKEPVSFLWAEDGDQPPLQQKYDLCTKGFPCTIGIDHRINKDLGYKVFFRRFSSEDLTKNVNELLSERRAFIPVKGSIPEVVVSGQASKHTDL